MLQPSVQVTNTIRKSRYVAALFVQICLVLALALTGCVHRAGPILYEDAQSKWREGDLALRCGWSKESMAIVARGESNYSHIGLLHHDSLIGWTVVHAVPDEDDPELLKTEPVSVFWSHERAQLGAWIRVDCSDSVAAEAVAYALRKVEERTPFDNFFRLADTTELYCTELVWRSYLSQGLDVTAGHRTRVPVMICREGECIFPGDIEKSENSLFVKHLN